MWKMPLPTDIEIDHPTPTEKYRNLDEFRTLEVLMVAPDATEIKDYHEVYFEYLDDEDSPHPHMAPDGDTVNVCTIGTFKDMIRDGTLRREQ